MRDSGRDEVFLSRAIGARRTRNREDEFAGDDDSPLGAVRVLGDHGIPMGFDEDGGCGRPSQKPNRDVAERRVGLREPSDDLGKSGHGPGRKGVFMNLVCARIGDTATLAAVVPLQRLEGHQLPGAARDLNDFRQGNVMIPFLQDVLDPAFDPCGASRDDWQA